MVDSKRKWKHIVLLSLAVVYLMETYYTTATAQVAFKDVTAEAGIRHQFVVYEGMFGGGACVLDFNNDGYEDIFLTGGIRFRAKGFGPVRYTRCRERRCQ